MQRAAVQMQLHPGEQGFARCYRSQSQAGAHDLAERVEPHDPAVDVERQKAPWLLVHEVHEVVGVVLEDYEVVELCELVDLHFALVRVHRSNWIRASRVHVEDLPEDVCTVCSCSFFFWRAGERV